VMESLVRDKIMEHLDRNSLIRPSQHGFMSGRSTATNMLVYMEALTRLYVRPHLEYAVVSWSPWLQQDKVQRRAVGMVTNLRRGTYEERLAEAGMLSLEDRRERGDMIATYKILSGKDKVEPEVIFGLGGDGPGPRSRPAMSSC
jgi:hypothetical protein